MKVRDEREQGIALKNKSAAAVAALAGAVALTEEVAHAQTTVYVPAAPLYDAEQYQSINWDPTSNVPTAGDTQIYLAGCHGSFRYSSASTGDPFDDAQVLATSGGDAVLFATGDSISNASAVGDDSWGSNANFATFDTPFFFAYRLHETLQDPGVYDYGFAELEVSSSDGGEFGTITVFQWGLSVAGSPALVPETAAIPEPATWGLPMGLVVLGLAGWRRIKRRRLLAA